MKYKSKIYAEALVNVMDSKKNIGSKILNNFFELLEKNGDMKKAKEIISLAEAIFLKKNNNKKIILETARNVDVKSIIKDFTKKGDVIEEKVNPKIIAGIKITVDNERQLDFSLLKKLENIF